MLNHEIKYFNQDISILLWFSKTYVFLSSLRLVTSINGNRKLDSVVLNKSVTISFQFCFFKVQNDASSVSCIKVFVQF